MPRLLFALCILCTTLPLAAEPPVTAEKPWVREAPPGTSVAAAYLILHNQGDETVSLTAISADEFESAELHETVDDDDQTRMSHIESLAIPAGERVTLEPGGKHIMLNEPRRELQDGDWVTLTLRFDNNQLLQLATPVRKRTGRETRSDKQRQTGHHGDHQ